MSSDLEIPLDEHDADKSFASVIPNGFLDLLALGTWVFVRRREVAAVTQGKLAEESSAAVLVSCCEIFASVKRTSV